MITDFLSGAAFSVTVAETLPGTGKAVRLAPRRSQWIVTWSAAFVIRVPAENREANRSGSNCGKRIGEVEDAGILGRGAKHLARSGIRQAQDASRTLVQDDFQAVQRGGHRCGGFFRGLGGVRETGGKKRDAQTRQDDR